MLHVELSFFFICFGIFFFFSFRRGPSELNEVGNNYSSRLVVSELCFERNLQHEGAGGRFPRSLGSWTSLSVQIISQPNVRCSLASCVRSRISYFGPPKRLLIASCCNSVSTQLSGLTDERPQASQDRAG